MPANVVAIVMDSPKDELSCVAFSDNFMQNGENTSRGVISYYAVLVLPEAGNFKDWLKLISAQAKTDIEQKKLNVIRAPKLKIIGDANTLLPGNIAAKINK